MRVLIATGLTGWGIGGVQTETINLVAALQNLGVDVALAVDRLPEALAGTRHFQIGYPPRKKAGDQLEYAISQFDPDVLHVIGGGIGFLSDAQKLELKCPWIFTAHNVPPFERILHRIHRPERLHYLLRDLKSFPSIRQWKMFLRRSQFDRVIAHSDSVISSLRRYGCPSGKCVLIPLGTDINPVNSPTRSSVIGQPGGAHINIVTVSGIAHHKGIHTFLEAFIKVSNKFPTAKYHIVGQRRDETYLQYLLKIISDNKLGDRVEIYRNASTEVRDGLLDRADLYVQPSHEEGFCLAMMEASLRVPRLLGTNSGAIAQMLEGDPSAELVDIKSARQLASATVRLLQSKADFATVQSRATRLSNKFSWSRYLIEHLTIYNTLAGTGRVQT